MKYLALVSIFLMFNVSVAKAQMAYMDEVKALGVVAGQALACGAPKYDTFELLARTIMISKAPSDKLQADAMYTYNEAKANAYVSKQMDGFYECDQFIGLFTKQDIFNVTLYRDGTLKMPDGNLIKPRNPYDATFVYDKDVEVDAEEIYSSGGDADVGEIRIKPDGGAAEVKTIYKPSTGEDEFEQEMVQPSASERNISMPEREAVSRLANDPGIGHIKSRWKN